jgi:hypothetical protein
MNETSGDVVGSGGPELILGGPGTLSAIVQWKLFDGLRPSASFARTRNAWAPERRRRYVRGALQLLHARLFSEHWNVVAFRQRVPRGARQEKVALGDAYGGMGVVIKTGRGTGAERPGGLRGSTIVQP